MTPTAPDRTPRKRSRVLLFVLVLCIPGLLLGLTRLFVLHPFNSPSSSGVPNLVIGDYFFVSQLAYTLGDPQRGDIATFRKPSNPSVDYVKRVIGLPGDRIQLKEGRLFINGEMVPRVAETLALALPDAGGLIFYRETLPGGRSYMIAEVSDDGAADNTEEYVVPAGHYFVLGDNRDNSQDSRYLDEVGYVPRNNFTGRYAFRFWNSAGVPLAGRPEERP